MIDKTREVALKTLYKIDKEQAYSNIALDEMLKQNKNILSLIYYIFEGNSRKV